MHIRNKKNLIGAYYGVFDEKQTDGVKRNESVLAGDS
ncbi:hypothetical protein SAMN04489735_10255 [Aneurinibacillus thermoaerophilus]|uniref:Uncharacterized protein n=1 Tax=Aneurinibacillus thermoaerophilus TaxID=143495 RepID=A0A1G8CE97_ANETH|nr:hypothetical protein SAMN04489735_10255 [Aneurinibacillus thermoaerophilus]